MGHVTWPRPLQRRFVICRLWLAMFNPHITFEMSTITCNEVMKGNVKCKNSGFEPSFGNLGADAWIRHCNATTRQQISVYSKLTFACMYPLHWEKWGVQKIFFARSARESGFVPLTFRIAAPPLRGTVVERRSLAGELSLSCARPVADRWPLMWLNRPL